MPMKDFPKAPKADYLDQNLVQDGFFFEYYQKTHQNGRFNLNYITIEPFLLLLDLYTMIKTWFKVDLKHFLREIKDIPVKSSILDFIQANDYSLFPSRKRFLREIKYFFVKISILVLAKDYPNVKQ